MSKVSLQRLLVIVCATVVAVAMGWYLFSMQMTELEGEVVSKIQVDLPGDVRQKLQTEKSGLLDEVRGSLNTSTLSNSELYTKFTRLGSIEWQMGELKKAQQWYGQASLLFPKEPLPFFSIASINLQAGDVLKGIESIELALGADPMNTEYWRTRFDLEQKKYPKDVDRMAYLFSRAIFATGEHPDIFTYMAKYYEQQGEVGVAIEQWQQARARNPEGSATYAREILRLQELERVAR